MMRRGALLFLTAVLALAGCATRNESPGTAGRSPARIVSLSPSATETLFAVGAGSQVVAVDSASNHPEQAPHTTLSGLNPDPEAIAGHHPDLVIVSSDLGNKLSDALAKAGTKTLVLPDAKTLDEAYAQFALVGKETGHQAEGESLAKQTKDDIEKIVADTPKPTAPLSYYYELDQTYYSATSATFIGQVFSRFGLANIADGTDPQVNGGYPQLSAERILRADPALIFLADTKCCGQNAETVGARPGWNTLTAVKEGRVVALDDDIASRWSPRVVDLVRAVADAVAKASQ